MTLATLLFIISLAGAAGTYAWKEYLVSAQNTYKQDLATREKQFNTDLIEQLKGENVKIDLARKILNNHIALSQIFDIIGRLTIESVRFLNLDVSVPATSNDGIKVRIVALGRIFREAALDDPAQGRGDGGRQRLRLIANDGRHGFSGARADKRALAGGQFVND